MSNSIFPPKKRLSKKARKGFRGYPVASIAYYGPDDQMATKVAVGIIMKEDGEAELMERWYSTEEDIRKQERIHQEIFDFIQTHEIRTVVMPSKIIGCPHEEGKDYPDGEKCPECPYWKNRDRWTGEYIH